jgi:hypothetical protein
VGENVIFVFDDAVLDEHQANVKLFEDFLELGHRLL